MITMQVGGVQQTVKSHEDEIYDRPREANHSFIGRSLLLSQIAICQPSVFAIEKVEKVNDESTGGFEV